MRWKEIITEAFKMDAATRRWFSGSKVVDDQGNPLLVYHGTNQPIVKFSNKRKGMNSSHPTAKTGFFFTDNPEIASDYAALAGRNVRADISTHEKESERLQKETERLERIAQRTGKNSDWDAYSKAVEAYENIEIGSLRADPLIGQNVVPVYLRILHPMELDAKGKSINDIEGTYLGDAIEKAKALKNDGVIIHNLDDAPTLKIPCTHYIAFSPNQIKSVFTGKPKVTESANGQYFYHATISPHIESIFKQGLLPNTDREKNWHFRDMPENVTFLADDAKTALYYGKLVSDNHYNNLGWETKPFVVILRTLLKNVKKPTKGENEYYTEFPIAANKLEILIHGKWKPLLSAKEQVENIGYGSWDWSEEDEENNDNSDEYYKDLNETKITELFQQPSKASWDWMEDYNKDSRTLNYEIKTTNGRRYVLTVSFLTMGIWSVSFMLSAEGTRSGSTGILKTGGAPEIFNALADCLRNFVNFMHPTAFMFTAKGGSRQRLYDVLAKKMASELGWVISKEDLEGTLMYVVTKPKNKVAESKEESPLPIPATQDNIAKVKEFVFKKWQERAVERGETVRDLSNSCKFTSMFAQKIFGGEIRGNYNHQYLVLGNKIIDLNDEADDVLKMKNPWQHDKKFFGKRDHKASMKSCEPRVDQWVEEFIQTLG